MVAARRNQRKRIDDCIRLDRTTEANGAPTVEGCHIRVVSKLTGVVVSPAFLRTVAEPGACVMDAMNEIGRSDPCRGVEECRHCTWTGPCVASIRSARPELPGIILPPAPNLTIDLFAAGHLLVVIPYSLKR